MPTKAARYQGEATLDGRSQTLPTLYELPATDFHDIVTSGPATNPPADANPHAVSVGYDEVTGLGSPVANLIVTNLVGPDFSDQVQYADLTGNGHEDMIFRGVDNSLWVST